MPEQSQNRQVAFKLKIADILDGQYVKEEGWTPNYVLTEYGKKVSRVNLIGAVVSIPEVETSYKSMMIDDGSRQISIRSFEDSDVFNGINIGDLIFVIGRPREYNTQIYIMPEIVKKVQNNAWVEIRKIEIEQMKKEFVASAPVAIPEIVSQSIVEEEVVEDKKEENSEVQKIDDIPSVETTPVVQPAEEKPKPVNSSTKIYELIKELDKGEGANFEEILEKSQIPEAEKIISQLLMEGEIFELGKGKLKVLE